MTQAPLFPLRRYAVLLAVLLSAACDRIDTAPPESALEPGVAAATRVGPPGAAPGTCWGKTVSPAVVQSVSNQVQVKPATMNPDGTVAVAPVFRTETTQQIVTPRKDNWFETPCPDVLTPEFVASLQRALAARGLYTGLVNGELDNVTRRAVRKYQQPKGPDSEVLSLATAQELGLVATPQ